MIVEHELRNRNGMTVRFLSLGGIVTAIEAPDRSGRRTNVVVGLGDAAAYAARNHLYYFGGIVGRYAGRIADARFDLDGRTVELEANEGDNTLHGAGVGFHARAWQVERIDDTTALLTLTSPAGDQGFPGTLTIEALYRLDEAHTFEIAFTARTDAPTAINLTSHIYFNLSGGERSVRDHELRLFADCFVETDGAGIPTGSLPETAGTSLDFAMPRRIGDGLEAAPQVLGQTGYNHGWLVQRETPDDLVRALRLSDPGSGRVLDVSTTAPSVHLYTANHFSGADVRADGRPLLPQAGLAIETQHLSDSVHHPAFPSTILRPGETYRSRTLYAFSAGRA